jgi:hypothetical protein
MTIVVQKCVETGLERERDGDVLLCSLSRGKASACVRLHFNSKTVQFLRRLALLAREASYPILAITSFPLSRVLANFTQCVHKNENKKKYINNDGSFFSRSQSKTNNTRQDSAALRGRCDSVTLCAVSRQCDDTPNGTHFRPIESFKDIRLA